MLYNNENVWTFAGWVYDTDKLRYYLHGAAFAFILIGNLFDIGTIIYADRIKDMFEDDKIQDEENVKENEPLNTTSDDLNDLNDPTLQWSFRWFRPLLQNDYVILILFDYFYK